MSCLSGTALPDYLQFQRLHIHHTSDHSKNPKCEQEWSKIKVMTRPGEVIADGAGGMGPCPYVVYILYIY
jgi:hypothetical protein